MKFMKFSMHVMIMPFEATMQQRGQLVRYFKLATIGPPSIDMFNNMSLTMMSFNELKTYQKR
jgi:hypothetical protein